jgi:hypothetical protein
MAAVAGAHLQKAGFGRGLLAWRPLPTVWVWAEPVLPRLAMRYWLCYSLSRLWVSSLFSYWKIIR